MAQTSGYIAVPIGGIEDQILLKPEDINYKLLGFAERQDIPLESWLDFCRVALESGDVDLFTKFAEATAKEAKNSKNSWRGKAQRIKALCSLGDFYLERSKLVEDEVQKRELMNSANRLYFDAQRMDPKEMLPHLGIGEVSRLSGNLAVARKEFEVAQRSLNNGMKSVAGYIALGRLEVHSKNYDKALKMYRMALKECPTAPAELRTAIGACHFYLGNLKKARTAYLRALDIDNECTPALLGLAVLEIIDEENNAGAKHLMTAYEQDPNNPYTLVLLSHFALQQGMYDLSAKFSQAVQDRSPIDEDGLRAEAFTLLGRSCHAKGDVTKAFELYHKALGIDKTLKVPRLASAQISAQKRDLIHAGNLFQGLLKDSPGWVDVLTCFGPLIPHVNFNMVDSKLLDDFQTALQQESDNVYLWEILGDITSVDDPAKALKSYTKAIQMYQQEKGSSSDDFSNVSSRVLNNTAVLYFRSGHYSSAFTLVSAAIGNAQMGALGKLHPASQVTLGYNIARIKEAMGDIHGAEKDYSDLLKEFPKYIDCLLRLACISKKKGDINAAEAWARKAAERSSNSADALALLAGIYLERRDLPSAKRSLEELQRALPPGAANIETYGRVALGNIHLYSIPGELHNDKNYEKAGVHLTHAIGLYKRALERDAGNVFAANGVGCVLAEAGRLSEAKEVFLRVQEAAAATDGFVTIPDAWLNVASTQLGLESFKAAVSTYEQAMKKHSSLKLDPRILLYLSKAQYENQEVLKALKTISKALHLAPADNRLRFNAGYLMQQYGAQALHKKEELGSEEDKVEKYSSVALAFETSHRIFVGLQELGQVATGIPNKKLEHHVGFASEMHKIAIGRLESAKKEAAAMAFKRHEQALRRRAAEMAKEMEERKKEAEAKAAALHSEQIAKEAEMHLQNLKQAWKQGRDLAKAVAEGDSGAIQRGSKAAVPGGPADALDALFNVTDEDDDEYDPTKAEEDIAVPFSNPEDNNDEEDPLRAAGLLSSDEEEVPIDDPAGNQDAPDEDMENTNDKESSPKRERTEEKDEEGDNKRRHVVVSSDDE